MKIFKFKSIAIVLAATLLMIGALDNNDFQTKCKHSSIGIKISILAIAKKVNHNHDISTIPTTNVWSTNSAESASPVLTYIDTPKSNKFEVWSKGTVY